MENTYTTIKFIYGAEELANETINVSLLAFNKILKRKGFYFKRTEFLYDEIKGFSRKDSQRSYHQMSENYLTTFGISKERYKNLFTLLSKKDKKRINRLLSKLSEKPNVEYRLIKLLNFIESKTGKRNYYSFGNWIEDNIATKRKVYKELVKYIKMDLPEELKKAKIAYKEAKGDYYKEIAIEIKKDIEPKKFSIFNIFKK